MVTGLLVSPSTRVKVPCAGKGGKFNGGHGIAVGVGIIVEEIGGVEINGHAARGRFREISDGGRTSREQLAGLKVFEEAAALGAVPLQGCGAELVGKTIGHEMGKDAAIGQRH